MSAIYVSKSDIEAFVELVDAQTWEPNYRRCEFKAKFTLPCGVEVRLQVPSIEMTPNGNFYGRSDTWTHVKLSDWVWENVSMFGKGARGDEAHNQLFELISVLGNFEGWNGLRGQ